MPRLSVKQSRGKKCRSLGLGSAVDRRYIQQFKIDIDFHLLRTARHKRRTWSYGKYIAFALNESVQENSSCYFQRSPEGNLVDCFNR